MKYEQPKIEILMFEYSDVVCSSPGGGMGTGQGGSHGGEIELSGEGMFG